MEPIHAELLRLATELEAVKCQVHGGTSGVDGAAHIAKAHPERGSHAMRTEHESKFSEMAADSVKNNCNESYASQGCAREIPRRTFPV